MKKNMASIEFESRTELGELLRMVETYLKEHPEEKNNDVIRQFYSDIDYIELTW